MDGNSFIHDVYTVAMIPPGLTSATVTEDHLILQAAIDILEGENHSDYRLSGDKIRDGDTAFDPSPGFVAREKSIGRLKKRLADLVIQYIMLGGLGVLVD